MVKVCIFAIGTLLAVTAMAKESSSIMANIKNQPDNELANKQLGHVLENCIDKLPDAFRGVFMLRAIE